MMKEFAPETRIKMLYSGRAGAVISRCDCTGCLLEKGIHQYHVSFDDGDGPGMISNTEIAPEGHAIHSIIAGWKEEMKQQGFKSIIVGKDTNGRLHSVLFNGHASYNKAMASIKDVTWIHYWSMRE